MLIIDGRLLIFPTDEESNRDDAGKLSNERNELNGNEPETKSSRGEKINVHFLFFDRRPEIGQVRANVANIVRDRSVSPVAIDRRSRYSSFANRYRIDGVHRVRGWSLDPREVRVKWRAKFFLHHRLDSSEYYPSGRSISASRIKIFWKRSQRKKSFGVPTPRSDVFTLPCATWTNSFAFFRPD